MGVVMGRCNFERMIEKMEVETRSERGIQVIPQQIL
jgi:hypothetical protein